MPSSRPTSQPTPETLTTGWIWKAGYDNWECTGPITWIEEAYRLGHCFVGKYSSYIYSCNQDQSKFTLHHQFLKWILLTIIDVCCFCF